MTEIFGDERILDQLNESEYCCPRVFKNLFMQQKFFPNFLLWNFDLIIYYSS